MQKTHVLSILLLAGPQHRKTWSAYVPVDYAFDAAGPNTIATFGPLTYEFVGFCQNGSGIALAFAAAAPQRSL